MMPLFSVTSGCYDKFLTLGIRLLSVCHHHWASGHKLLRGRFFVSKVEDIDV